MTLFSDVSHPSSLFLEMPGLNCRFYQHRFPEVEDVVMVNVRSIAEMGAYVSLLEYNNIEGMILLSELSRRRIRSINKLIRIGRNECVVVIRVDKEKGEGTIRVTFLDAESISEVCQSKTNTCLTRAGRYEKMFISLFFFFLNHIDFTVLSTFIFFNASLQNMV